MTTTTTPAPATYRRPQRSGGLRGVLHALAPMTRPLRPSLPPPTVVGRFDPQLAAEINAVYKADREALDLARAWEATEPGGTVFDQIRADELRLIATGTRPADNAGPMFRLLTIDGPAAFVAAYRAQLRADHNDAELRRHVPDNKKLRSSLEAECTRIEDEMAACLAKVTGKNSRLPYLQAMEHAEAYGQTWSLLAWVINPTEPYRQSRKLIPYGQVVPEHLAALAVGEKRGMVPDQLLPRAGSDNDPTWTGLKPRR